MQKLSPIRFGIAIGTAGVVFYFGCMIFMAAAPNEIVVWFFNSLLHGADISSIVRDSVPWMQSLVGLLSTFVGGLISGSISARIYHVGISSGNAKS